jgi:hypothetical protein
MPDQVEGPSCSAILHRRRHVRAGVHPLCHLHDVLDAQCAAYCKAIMALPYMQTGSPARSRHEEVLELDVGFETPRATDARLPQSARALLRASGIWGVVGETAHDFDLLISQRTAATFPIGRSTSVAAQPPPHLLTAGSPSLREPA